MSKFLKHAGLVRSVHLIYPIVSSQCTIMISSRRHVGYMVGCTQCTVILWLILRVTPDRHHDHET